MNPRPFDYHAPRTVEEAASLMERYGSEAKLLAGGQSLLPLMKLRLLSPAHLIDLGKVEGLSYIRKEGGALAIGAMTRMSEVARSETIKKECGILIQCALQIADPLVRNMGTLGGNLAHADPANDMPAVMVATGATLVVASKTGRRTVPASQFFVDTFVTALAEGEILVEARVPTGPGRLGAYLKLERQAGDFGIVGVAVVLDLDPDGRCSACGIGLSGVGSAVVKARKAEGVLVGTKLERGVIDRASAAAAGEAQPSSDLRGSAEYKRGMVGVMTARAILEALKGRGGT